MVMEILLLLDSSFLTKTKYMFDQILELVKEHLGNNPEITANVPADQQEALHNEIANHVANSLTTQPTEIVAALAACLAACYQNSKVVLLPEARLRAP